MTVTGYSFKNEFLTKFANHSDGVISVKFGTPVNKFFLRLKFLDEKSINDFG